MKTDEREEEEVDERVRVVCFLRNRALVLRNDDGLQGALVADELEALALELEAGLHIPNPAGQLDDKALQRGPGQRIRRTRKP